MADTALRYVETTVEIADEPLDVAVRLAEAGPHAEHVVYEKDGEYAYAGGVLARVVLDRNGGRSGGVALAWHDRPLALLGALLDGVPVRGWRAYGWAAFELAYAAHDLPRGQLAHLVVPRSEVRLTRGHALIRALEPAALDTLAALVTARLPRATPHPAPVDVRQSGGHRYRAAVAGAIEEITTGLARKVVLSRVVDVPTDVDLAATYLLGRRATAPARSFLLRVGGLEAVGFSPEIVVSVGANGDVVSQPLAGSRALADDRLTVERRRAEPALDVKEAYEHALSLKVGNDELLTVCDPDSVHVRELMPVKHRGTVRHVAATLAGRLAAGTDSWDAFAALFPSVTATGVEKEAAFAAIRRHESEPRGLYGGAVLTVDESGVLDAALALRTVLRKQGRTWLRAGAGVVARSTPGREFEETCEKLDSVARFLVPARSVRNTDRHGFARPVPSMVVAPGAPG